MKKTIITLTALLLTISFASCKGKTKKEPEKQEAAKVTEQVKPAKPVRNFVTETAVKDTGSKPMKGLTGLEITYDMKTGWNMGNTLDATGMGLSSETYWGQPKTTKEMIDGLAKSGFKVIRIPTTWHNHIIDLNYTIDPLWMARVKEIVDWAIGNDMYVVLNTHHDNHSSGAVMLYKQGYYPTLAAEEESLSFLTNVWKQIALAFNNGYDEHLVFETMNEPRLCGTQHEWNYSSTNTFTTEAQNEINKFNQEILNVIRASGGNNAKRLVMVPGYACATAPVLSNEFVLPEDPANMVGVTVHMYTPYVFAMDPKGTSTYTPRMATELQTTFKQLENKFVKNGIPVYIGEYGATNKENDADRIQWFNTFIRQTRKMGIPCMLWDNQAYKIDANGYSEKYGYYNRYNQTWFVPEITKTIMDAADLK